MNKQLAVTDISNRQNQDNVLFKHYTDLFNSAFDLSVYQSGHKIYSTPGFLSRLSIYDHYIIHYITSGKGTYFIDGQSLTVQKGQCFLIPPYKLVQYQADQDDPWAYYWVGFNGPKALDLLHSSDFYDHHVITPESSDIENLLKNLVNLDLPQRSLEYGLLGYIYLIFAQLMTSKIRDTSEQNHYYRQAINYIHEHFADPDLSVEKVANKVGLTRSYLYKIFQSTANSSISETIQNLRLSKAAGFLERSDYSIKEITNMVGFNSQAYFSKLFKEQFKRSPTDYRKKIVEKHSI